MTMTAVIGDEHGRLIALNEQNHTWFRLPDRRQLAMSSRLFSFGTSPAASKIVVRLERQPANHDAGPNARVIFSYVTAGSFGPTIVNADVSGVIELWSAGDTKLPALPWNPAEIATGIGGVDDALAQEISRVPGTIIRSHLTVHRRLEGGPAFTDEIERKMDSIPAPPISPAMFEVPKGDRYQEPVIGAPGAGPSPVQNP